MLLPLLSNVCQLQFRAYCAEAGSLHKKRNLEDRENTLSEILLLYVLCGMVLSSSRAAEAIRRVSSERQENCARLIVHRVVEASGQQS